MRRILPLLALCLIPFLSGAWTVGTSNVFTSATNSTWQATTNGNFLTVADDGLLRRVIFEMPAGLTNLDLRIIETGSGHVLMTTNSVIGATNATTTILWEGSEPFYRKDVQTQNAQNGAGSNNLDVTIYILRER